MRNGSDLTGVACAIVTPINDAGQIDVQQLRAHCEDMLAQGCSFVSIFGTTGEGASFSAREKIAALEALASAGTDMSRQMPGIIAASVDEAAALYNAIDRLGCRAALIIPPFYYTPTAQGVANFYEAVIKAAGAPATDIVLYNFPNFSGVTFTPELVNLVSEHCGGRVVGIKDSTGDLEAGITLIESFPELSIFTGDDRVLTRMVAAGGAGMIGGLPNLFAQDCIRLFDGTASADLQALAAKRIEVVDHHGGLVILKALLAQQNNSANFARLAPPLCAAPAELVASIDKALTDAAKAETA